MEYLFDLVCVMFVISWLNDKIVVSDEIKLIEADWRKYASVN